VGRRALAKETALYVTRVHRLGEGDTFVAFDPERAIEADARIVEVGARSVAVQIDAVRPAEVVAPRAVTLVQALGKGDKLDAIVRDATELGAVRIVPVIAERSVVRPADVAGRAQRWRRIAVEAARQCGRGDVPQIDAPVPLIEAVHALAAEARPAPSSTPAVSSSSSTPAVASSSSPPAVSPSSSSTSAVASSSAAAVRPWGACLAPGGAALLGDLFRALAPAEPFTIVVGPEGGFSPQEIAACEASGLAIAGMGPLVLRTETVCAAVLGALLLLAPSPAAT
jgi:16S rRNA (uracil1498-N3)-methyltransferase